MAYDVNSYLRRTLLSGDMYNTYFKESSCTPTYLGTNDTAFTVQKMREWAIKNIAQTKKLALGEFTGKSLPETVQMVYRFLYSHIQYKLDGSRQNLKSPACAWATREEGTDCKSYSIFASTILSNLGIKHYFRRVKQPGENEDKWTHVYIVVPADQKNPKKSISSNYYVLDATVHDNKEVRFTEKSDSLMEKVSLVHYGLQAPAIQNGLAGCSCVPKTKPAPVVVAPTPAPAPVFTYEPVTQPNLINGGVVNTRTSQNSAPVATRNTTAATATPRTTTTTRNTGNSTTSATVRSSTNTNASNVNRSTGNTRQGGSAAVVRTKPELALRSPNIQGVNCPNPSWLGYVSIPTVDGAPAHGNNLSKGSNITAAAGQTLAMVKQGAGAGTIVKSAAGILPIAFATGPAAPFVLAGAAILALIPNKFYDKVIGQFFSNGLRFDCVGSSRSPSTSKKQLQREIPIVQAEAQKMLQSFQSGNIAQIEAAINMFMEFFYSVDAKGRWWLANGARDCTRDGLIISVKGLDEAKKEIIKITGDTLKQYGANLVQNGTRKITYPADSSVDKPENTFDVEQYKVVVDQSVLAQQAQQSQQNVQPTGTSRSIADFLPKVSTAGFGGNTLMILAAIAAGTYIYSKQ